MRERAFEAERRQRLPGADEGFLHQVLGAGGVWPPARRQTTACTRREWRRYSASKARRVAEPGGAHQRVVAVVFDGFDGRGIHGHGGTEHTPLMPAAARRV